MMDTMLGLLLNEQNWMLFSGSIVPYFQLLFHWFLSFLPGNRSVCLLYFYTSHFIDKEQIVSVRIRQQRELQSTSL